MASSIFGESVTITYYDSAGTSQTKTIGECAVKVVSTTAEKSQYRDSTNVMHGWRSKVKNTFSITILAGDATLDEVHDICNSPECTLAIGDSSYVCKCITNYNEQVEGVTVDIPTWVLQFEELGYHYIFA